MYENTQKIPKNSGIPKDTKSDLITKKANNDALTSGRWKAQNEIVVIAENGVLSKRGGCPHHAFTLPSERNIHAVIRVVPGTLKEAKIKEELQQRRYAPLHIIRLKRSGAPMPLVVVIQRKLDKSRELFNEHELLGLATRVEVKKNARLIGQVHRCQR
nr:unnamed protein product [Callosobruchus analis]